MAEAQQRSIRFAGGELDAYQVQLPNQLEQGTLGNFEGDDHDSSVYG